VGDTWSGEAWIRFGDAGNAGPVFASAQVFDEIWARVWVRTQDGWPGGGYGEVLEISAREGPQGARVATVVAGGDPMQNYLGLQARTCIDAGMLQCDGMMDWQTDRFLAGSGGSTIINDPEQGPQWHCIVMHVQLNQAGMTDGFASLIVDGVEDVVLYDLDLRGTWDQTGLNTVRINSSWPGGATGTVERYMDDIVIANAPLECP
jgi:hypothetical protein